MIKYYRFFITFLLIVIAFAAKSQSTATTSSPYSRFGLGDIDQGLLPQSVAMGGISTAINRISGYNTINPQNPGSYGFINLTTIDIGIYSNNTTFTQTGQPQQSNLNFRLSHVTFAIPVSKHSALSFGLLPYSQVGYNNIQTYANYGTKAQPDTNAVNNIYSGEGGLSKAYFGYGVTLFKHLAIGANVSYIFGNLKNYESTEIPTLYGVQNTMIEQSNSVRGINYDYGAQYAVDFSDTKHLTFGYSASAGNSIGTQTSYIVSQYTNDGSGNQNVAADTVKNIADAKGKIQLPQINHFGVSFQKDNSFLIGADFTTGHWSSLTINGVNPGFQDSKMVNVGGQITPNVNSRNYFSLIDYRLGFLYEQTYLNSNAIYGTNSSDNISINRYAVTFGFGLPLRNDQLTFYKINFATEIGQRGTVANGLIRENYVNFHLGFTFNDKWFRRYKFE